MLKDLPAMCAGYRVVIVPPVRFNKPRPWWRRLMWCPWRAYDTLFIDSIPTGQVRIDTERMVIYMNETTAARARKEFGDLNRGIFRA